MSHRFTLEKYKSGKRFACPRCGHSREFARYVDTQTGDYLSVDAGKCNRDSKCGYHYTPKQFFADNPTGKKFSERTRSKTKNLRKPKILPDVSLSTKKTFDCVPTEYFLQTLANYERNAFVQFLDANIESESVLEALKKYFVGTLPDGRTVFWQIDPQNRVRTGKLIAYDATTGKRRKNKLTSWVHAELKRRGVLSETFELKQCFFGEHLLSIESLKPIAIVEAEKTAVIASILLPEFVWLAIGSKQSLKAERLRRFAGRRIVLFPDADGFELWTKEAERARRIGLRVECSDLIERSATTEEKANGFDLADYLIPAAWKKMHEINAAIDRVLNDELLFAEFEKNVVERLGKLNDPNALRRIALEIDAKERSKRKSVAQSL
jgi:hypothetical protein